MRNSSCSFMPIVLKRYRCFCHGLKMCMWVGYYSQNKFCYCFRILNLVVFEARILSKCIDSEYLMCATPTTVLYQSFWNFTCVFCQGLKMCMWFGYNPQIKVWSRFRIVNLVIFQAWIISKGIDCGYLVRATPPTVLCRSFWNVTGICVMDWRCACYLDSIYWLSFVQYCFRILNLVIFEVRIL